MNKELRSELETQGNLLETMRVEMETLKGGASTTGGVMSFICASVINHDITKVMGQ
jgi:hypothetical protein